MSTRTVAAVAAQAHPRPSPSKRPLAPELTKRPRYAADMVELYELMGEELTKMGKASSSRFVVSSADVLVNEFDHGSGKAQRARIGTKLPNDRLDMTVIVNVDGRQGAAQARAWGKSDTYVIEVTHPNGRVERMTGIKARGFVTTQDFSIRLQPGVTKIAAWPVGSLGVPGNIEGRLLELTYAPPRSNRS
jgi:hypothetical protein